MTPGAVPLDDRGLLLGDGLFETLLVIEGRLVLAEAHASRMGRGAEVLGIPPPTLEDFFACAVAAIRAGELLEGRAAVKITLTAGSGGRGLDRPATPAPRLFATAARAVKPATPAALIVAETRRNAGSPASRLKTLAYLDSVLARREATQAGADEAVMLNTEGHVACAAAANLFWVKDDIAFTPAPRTGCLDGIIARQVTEAAHRFGIAVREVSEGRKSLQAADAMFLTNSLIGVRPAYLAGQAPPAPNATVERLAAAVADVS